MKRSLTRRALITRAAAAAAATFTATPAAAAKIRDRRDAALYVPGYYPNSGWVNGQPLRKHRRFSRHIDDWDGPARILTRIGLDGSIRQTLLPVHAHDVEIAPDRSIGVLCGFEDRNHVAFDPVTLELAAIATSVGEGWRGGGHAAYFGDKVLLSERAPRAPLNGPLDRHFGKVTIRDAATLRTLETYSTYGIDPHEIQLIEDGRYLVAANYGSLPDLKSRDLTVPRQVIDASITVIDMRDGSLVEKYRTGARDTELRHVASGRLDRIFAIQSRLGDDEAVRTVEGDVGEVYPFDITTEAGSNYLPAATLRYDAKRKRAAPMGGRNETALMRHGLSIIYDERNDEAIATYPTTHRVMAFDGASGAVTAVLDTSKMGLRYPCGIALLPDGAHYAVTGYWENLFVFERRTHRLVRELCQYPVFFGHSHISVG
ncbi:DUF1513 domain-containing protein [Pseudorhizobium flavum]|uniref:DUF1513 domain-containing protein n=1 Tax=Pseudorhizobium flavum TaxID=1335061 RepID=A0A7W9Z1U8_9HYPH|nr:DUF1513 domain-containing protein [Pseudorhizobium flavum]MBB6182377.1 hypothetical protein [Pseudorhizobium flavum]CAD6602642.1 hypothetical protein RFYW14_01178 [Pseudorhizobium flavum]